MVTLSELESAAQLVYQSMPPTPQYTWPLLNQRYGREIWVKHENHTPTGAFKVRGGIVLIHHLRHSQPKLRGVCSATRGNHGQSLATSATRHGLACVIVVPQGNSAEKNAAMRAQGAELIEHGRDFDEARAFAAQLAQERGLAFVGPFRHELVMGVGTYALELFRHAPQLDVVYAPIGCGTGICGLISARDGLNLKTKIIGVVTETYPAMHLSFHAGQIVNTPPTTASTIADGIATRNMVPEAFEIVRAGAEDVVTVREADIESAMRAYYTDTHNVAEGGGAAALAAAGRYAKAGQRVGVILSGGNVDAGVFAQLLTSG
jgi:threonine dehydratase